MNDKGQESEPYSAKVSGLVPGIRGEITLTPTELLVMSHATEDWYGLYEFAGTRNYEPRELERSLDRRKLMIAAMRHLLQLGLIELGSIGWDDWVSGKAPKIVSAIEADGLLEDSNNWGLEQDSQIYFSATDLGSRFYFGELKTSE
jgi:hypothetical protein